MYYCSRPAAVRTAPGAVLRNAANASRNASFFPSPFYPTQYIVRSSPSTTGSDFAAPLIRLLDDFTAPLVPSAGQSHVRSGNNFFNEIFGGFPNLNSGFSQPRFDVKEGEDNYELNGELPGVASEGLEVEFPNARTLVVRGRTDSGDVSRPQGHDISDAAQNQSQIENTAAASTPEQTMVTESDKDKDNEDAASVYSTGSYQKPSVEENDEVDESQVAPASEEGKGKAPAADPSFPAATAAAPQETTQSQQDQSPRYWYKERTTGSFERVFRFEKAVDVQGVKATLKNGLLNIVVPKAAVAAPHRVVVQ